MTEAYQGPTPPPELVEEWRNAPQYATGSGRIEMVSMRLQRLQEIADKAARWGADRQLEQCVAWLDGYERDGWAAEQMRSCCRPKPPSLKEQALQALGHLDKGAESQMDTTEAVDTIRRALEALPND